MNILKDKGLETGKKVQVYRNLHKDCYSVRCAKTRRVIGHMRSVVLLHPRFKVNAKGRDRVRALKRKEVHAYVEGLLLSKTSDVLDVEGEVVISYNPYINDTFMRDQGDCQVPVERAALVVMGRDFRMRGVRCS